MIEKNNFSRYSNVLRGLINYHKRMVLPASSLSCKNDKGICPVIFFENDIYLETLEASLILVEREAKNDVKYLSGKLGQYIEARRNLTFLFAYSDMERRALVNVEKVIEWRDAGKTNYFPLSLEELNQTIKDLLEVLFLRCGGDRELFYSDPEYRIGRIREGNSPDVLLLEFADILSKIALEIS